MTTNSNDGETTAAAAAAAKCVPCASMNPSYLLSRDEVERRLKASPKLRLWGISTCTSATTTETKPNASSSHNNKAEEEKGEATEQQQQQQQQETTTMMISRSFVARDFQAALAAINTMGAIAEANSHHPDFHLTNYRNVRIDIWTHKVSGVTVNDLTLAELFDDVAIDYSPQWLTQHPEAVAPIK